MKQVMLLMNFVQTTFLLNLQVAVDYCCDHILKTCPCNIQRFFSYHIFKNCKFHWKKNDLFNIFAQNIDCGYKLEPPQRVPTIYVLEQK